MTNRTYDRLCTFFLAAVVVCLAALPAGGQDPPEKGKRKQEKKSHTYSLIVTVVMVDDSIESPVKGARVTLRTEDYRHEKPTEAEGRVSFKFETELDSAIVRVEAAHKVTDQQSIQFHESQNEYNLKVVLRKSD